MERLQRQQSPSKQLDANSPWTPIRFRWILFGTAVVSLFFVLNAWVAYSLGPQDNPFDWYFESLTVFTNYFLWAALIPIIYFVVVSREQFWSLSAKAVLVHLLAAVFIAVIHRYGALSLYVGITWAVKGYLLDLFGSHSIAWLISGTIPSFIQYWLIIGLLWGIRFYRLEKAKEIELIKKDQEIANAQYNALKMQLHPHFFFNTLNTISSVMDRNVEEAQEIVAKLAKLMRALVDSNRKEFTSVSDELEYIADYLHVEQARFIDTLQVIIECDEKAGKQKIPNLILQPLVENSIKHGFSQKIDIKKLIVSAKVEEGKLVLQVKDNGKGTANVDYIILNPNVGLNSVMERLKHWYGERANISIESELNKGFCVTLSILLEG